MSEENLPILEQWFDKFELDAGGEVQLKTNSDSYAGEIADPLTVEERMHEAADNFLDAIRIVKQ